MGMEVELIDAMMSAVLAWVKKGDWIAHAYLEKNKQISVMGLVREAWSSVDREALLDKITDKIEDRIAHQVAVHMIQEIGTDVKKAMSDQDFRAELRVLVKMKLRERGHA